jgi:hypothetical protein
MICSELISEHDTFDCQTRRISVCMASESALVSGSPKAESATDVGGQSRDVWRRSGRNERAPGLTSGNMEMLAHSQRELLLDVIICGFTTRLWLCMASLSSSD